MDLVLTLSTVGAILLIALSWRLFQRTPRLVVSERGILDRSVGLGWIGWDEIEGAYQRRSQEQDAVILRLRASARLVGQLKRAGRSEASGVGDAFDLRLDLSDAEVTAVELVQEIMAHASPTAAVATTPPESRSR